MNRHLNDMNVRYREARNGWFLPALGEVELHLEADYIYESAPVMQWIPATCLSITISSSLR
jgi:hypothetical protein